MTADGQSLVDAPGSARLRGPRALADHDDRGATGDDATEQTLTERGMQPLTISDVERQTGVSRSTVYYYISEGLLPPAQKASATRSFYHQSHVNLLREIGRLKEQGLDLREIGRRLAERVEDAAENAVDLVARQSEQTRSIILDAAARRFAERGYDNTRISDICREVGVTAQVLYSHFPSKRHLFIACFRVYFGWMHEKIAPAIEQTDDSAARLVWRSWAFYGIQALSPDLQALARVEAMHPESGLRGDVRETYRGMLADSERELTAARRPGANEALFDDVLVAHALLGALENMQMRASWDDRFTVEDVMRNHVAIFAAVRAAYAGRVDLTEDWRSVAPLVQELAAGASSPRAMAEDGRAKA